MADRSQLRHSEVATILIALVYPALLYGVLRWLAKDVLTGRIVVHCLISLSFFMLILENQTGVLYLLYPTACFACASILSALKIKNRRKIRVTRGADPVSHDEELSQRRITERQVARKYKSKRENTKWYKHGFGGKLK